MHQIVIQGVMGIFLQVGLTSFLCFLFCHKDKYYLSDIQIYTFRAEYVYA